MSMYELGVWYIRQNEYVWVRCLIYTSTWVYIRCWYIRQNEYVRVRRLIYTSTWVYIRFLYIRQHAYVRVRRLIYTSTWVYIRFLYIRQNINDTAYMFSEFRLLIRNGTYSTRIYNANNKCIFRKWVRCAGAYTIIECLARLNVSWLLKWNKNNKASYNFPTINR